MNKIATIISREILDSRGNPTVEAELRLSDGRRVLASAPSGASKGVHEALELRDNDAKRFGGLGVLDACAVIKDKIAPVIEDMDPVNLQEIDRHLCSLDGTPNKSSLGANATLAVSLVVAKAGALLRGKPLYLHLADLFGTTPVRLPTPMFNVINGGRHADNNLAVQEFMIVPGATDSFREALREAAEIFKNLKKILTERKDSTAVGDEGGFAPRDLDGPMEAMELLLEAAGRSGHEKNVRLALDLAASEFYDDGGYRLYPAKSPLSYAEMTAELIEWVKRYPVISFEDALGQDDWDGWAYLTKEIKARDGHDGFKAPLLVGDDLFVTNPSRLQRGIDSNTATAILIKPNQIGTITETAEVICLAKASGFATIASHRSGETEDAALAHIAAGLGTDGLKTGSVSRSERLAKYNELLRIEEELGPGKYRGPQALSQKSPEGISKS
ncbi:MAG: phosphopyruvate hydratase [Elusimicrobia bacterium]|nr:phosphopyruvate hydratase [Elusimicrobiota bacterium]